MMIRIRDHLCRVCFCLSSFQGPVCNHISSEIFPFEFPPDLSHDHCDDLNRPPYLSNFTWKSFRGCRLYETHNSPVIHSLFRYGYSLASSPSLFTPYLCHPHNDLLSALCVPWRTASVFPCAWRQLGGPSPAFTLDLWQTSRSTTRVTQEIWSWPQGYRRVRSSFSLIWRPLLNSCAVSLLTNHLGLLTLSVSCISLIPPHFSFLQLTRVRGFLPSCIQLPTWGGASRCFGRWREVGLRSFTCCRKTRLRSLLFR